MNKYKVLLLGGGGREHAIAWKLKQSPLLDSLTIVPGSDKLNTYGKCLPISLIQPYDKLLEYIKKEHIDIIVPGPEEPLVHGIRDIIEDKTSIPVFGPCKKGALLEGSKVFAKKFMFEENIPTAHAEFFYLIDEALEYCQNKEYPLVIKADGLAAGKGVMVCQNFASAKEALITIMKDRRFGRAGDAVIVEECLIGEEVSVFALIDGKTIRWLTTAQDFKRIGDGNIGPNTGGMGAYAPVRWVNDELKDIIEKRIISPTLNGIIKRKLDYRGIIYLGLMIKDRKNPFVLEYNCRWGDPETQVVMPRLKTDLLDIIIHTIEGRLNNYKIEWSSDKSLGVVLASEGYPGKPIDGKKIILSQGIPSDKTILFHSGTRYNNKEWITKGGRIFCLTGVDKEWDGVRALVYSQIKSIHFDGMQYRRDIGYNI